MTREEVIKIVNENAVPVFPLQIEYQDWLTAIQMVEEALDKQIPKKPTNNSWTHYHCPVCGKSVNSKYCGECGQAIDWNDED